MVTFTLMAAFLCTCSWISVSVSQFHAVEVQPGGEVTLMCSNFTTLPSHIFWFRLADTPNISCVSFMSNSDANASFCDGFKNGKFDMTSNTSTIFLRIKDVNSSDSGLYFCGVCSNNNSVIVSGAYLRVQGKIDIKRKIFRLEAFDGITKPMSVILGALIIPLILVIIGLVVKIQRLQTAHKGGQNPQHSQNLDSDNLNYAALSFHPKAKRNRRPASETQQTVYAATR
ncbi:uncharacterized protein [Pempheris klunzingeri]|uniref:uncharacterized protein n=1 Tax=Pempheris klunzingeri TaxID=3127111 RepID=UPI00397FDD68